MPSRLPEPDYSRPFDTAIPDTAPDESALQAMLLGQRSADQTWSILALCCGGFSLFLPYFAVVFFAPVGVMLGLVAAHKRHILPCLLAIAMSGGALWFHAKQVNKATAALQESSERLKNLFPK